MKMDETAFFNNVRKFPFPGNLKQSQVDGMKAIIAEWLKRPELDDLRWLAYMLATTYHETAFTMQPIEEYGKGAGRFYGTPHRRTGKIYYGRGFVQLTLHENYERMGNLLGVDLVNNPEKALEPDIAFAVMFEGMTRGMFTNKSLKQYFKKDQDADWYNARSIIGAKVVDGKNVAESIAKYGRAFWYALLAAAPDDADKSISQESVDTPPEDPEVLDIFNEFHRA
jgi:hypothetical protein